MYKSWLHGPIDTLPMGCFFLDYFVAMGRLDDRGSLSLVSGTRIAAARRWVEKCSPKTMGILKSLAIAEPHALSVSVLGSRDMDFKHNHFVSMLASLSLLRPYKSNLLRQTTELSSCKSGPS